MCSENHGVSPIILLTLRKIFTCFEMISPAAAVVADEDDVDSSLVLAIFHKKGDCGGFKVRYHDKPMQHHKFITDLDPTNFI